MGIFKDWVEHTGLRSNDFIEQTGMNVSYVSKMRQSEDWDDLRTRLAMSAIAAGLQPWSVENAHEADSVKPIVAVIRKNTKDSSDE